LKEQWNPKLALEAREDATSDPKKTIFIGRLSYKTTEQTLRQAFEKFGTIVKLRIVKDLDGKSRGYGFIEYKH